MKIETLTQRGFKFNKALGQNFITDGNLLRAISDDAEISSADTALEIGAGAGTLTAELAKKAGRVLTFEVDKNLSPFLNENLAGFNNVQIYFKDILKTPHQELTWLVNDFNNHSYGMKSSPNPEINLNNEELNSNDKPIRFKVVANLPYYITTPIIFYFLESGLAVDSITVMVQSEVAKRIVAKPATSDYGALTLAVAARCRAKITRTVARTVFTPQPNVDSAVVHLKVLRPFDTQVSRVIKCLFAMRRKTAANNLAAGFGLSKSRCEEILTKAGLKLSARGEEFNIEEVRRVAEILMQNTEQRIQM